MMYKVILEMTIEADDRCHAENLVDNWVGNLTHDQVPKQAEHLEVVGSRISTDKDDD